MPECLAQSFLKYGEGPVFQQWREGQVWHISLYNLSFLVAEVTQSSLQSKQKRESPLFSRRLSDVQSVIIS